MAVRQTGRKVYNPNARPFDMDLRCPKNELIAVGNVRVNARGDELGPGGKIVPKREDVLEDYYPDTSSTVLQMRTRIPGELQKLNTKQMQLKKKLQKQFQEEKMTLIKPKMMMVTLLKR